MTAADTTIIELSKDSTGSYLKERGVIPPKAGVTAEALGGGISNRVIRIVWEDGCLVVKQSLPKLRVQEEWQFSRSRIGVEERCLRYLGRILPAGSVPEVIYSDLDNYIFAMTCAPTGGVLWKQALLAGNIDSVAASRAGRLLALVHTLSARDSYVRDQFADQSVLVEGRVDPYHRTAAARHPDLNDAIDTEVRRLLGTREALVLGDYCPKNTFVYPDRLLILDFEVAHWGDPAFDLAFCINHFVLKAVRSARHTRELIAAAETFHSAYDAQTGDPSAARDAAIVRELGCLLLARIDGKSKIEYVTDPHDKEFVRSLARSLLVESISTLPDAFALIRERLHAAREETL